MHYILSLAKTVDLFTYIVKLLRKSETEKLKPFHKSLLFETINVTIKAEQRE